MNEKERTLEAVRRACHEAAKDMMEKRLKRWGCVEHEIKYARKNF